jgi:hypothetical protein
MEGIGQLLSLRDGCFGCVWGGVWNCWLRQGRAWSDVVQTKDRLLLWWANARGRGSMFYNEMLWGRACKQCDSSGMGTRDIGDCVESFGRLISRRHWRSADAGCVGSLVLQVTPPISRSTGIQPGFRQSPGQFLKTTALISCCPCVNRVAIVLGALASRVPHSIPPTGLCRTSQQGHLFYSILNLTQWLHTRPWMLSTRISCGINLR